jgi:enoyl-CoA hydratase/carnithine racemase
MLLMREMIAGSKPIVAAVEGHAYEAGLALSTIGAVQAHTIGLVDELSTRGGALELARQRAQLYAETPPLAFELMKSAFACGLEPALQAELDLQPYAWLSEDHEDGKRAFFEKRKLDFAGR